MCAHVCVCMRVHVYVCHERADKGVETVREEEERERERERNRERKRARSRERGRDRKRGGRIEGREERRESRRGWWVVGVARGGLPEHEHLVVVHLLQDVLDRPVQVHHLQRVVIVLLLVTLVRPRHYQPPHPHQHQHHRKQHHRERPLFLSLGLSSRTTRRVIIRNPFDTA